MTTWSEIATTRIKVDLPTIVGDNFNRTETDQWGTSTNGVVWTASGGVASNFAVDGSVGTITGSTADVTRLVAAAPTVTDAEFRVKLRVPQLITGDEIDIGFRIRAQDDDNAYWVTLYFQTDATIDAEMSVEEVGGFTVLDSEAEIFDHVIDKDYMLAVRQVGSSLKMKAWPARQNEPQTWTLEAEDDTFASGLAQVYFYRSAGNTNTNPVVWYDDVTIVSTDETMVDITDYALTVGNLGQNLEAARGRQTELSGMDPSRFSMRLNNMDGRFTPGNTYGAYYPSWEQDRRVVWTETIGYKTFILFDGYLEIPEVGLTFEAADDPTLSDRTVTVAAVDRLAQLDRTAPFISTLAEYIRFNAGPTLAMYWPLTDAVTPFPNVVARQKLLVETIGGSTTASDQLPAVEPQGGVAIPGDDGQFPQLLHGASAGAATGGEIALYTEDGLGTVASGETITMVAWVNIDLTYDVTQVLLTLTTDDGLALLRRESVADGGDFRLTIPTGNVTGAVDGVFTVGADVWYLIGIRWGFDPDSLEMWINDQTFDVTLAGASTTPTPISRYDTQMAGTIAHMQVYIGDGDLWTNDHFVAQWQAGLDGLERQTTGERIFTIAQYAGIPESDLDLIGDGSSVMQMAQLAGKTAGQAMREAVDTERGRLFTNGSQTAFHNGGKIVFHDRHHIYNG